jgi:hypothetical protein
MFYSFYHPAKHHADNTLQDYKESFERKIRLSKIEQVHSQDLIIENDLSNRENEFNSSKNLPIIPSSFSNETASIQVIYENLVPEDYEETIIKAEEVFDQLDLIVQSSEEKLPEELESREEGIDMEDNGNIQEHIDVFPELAIEEKGSTVENEDINNP